MPPAHKEVVRDINLPLRTFSEVRDRLDALTLLLGRSARSGLMEFYLARAIDAEEQGMGLLGADVEDGSLAERLGALKRLPQFQSLSESKRARVLALYRRVWAADRDLTPGQPGANYGRTSVLEIEGTRRTVQEWSKAKGAATATGIVWRLNAKWPAKEAVFTPLRRETTKPATKPRRAAPHRGRAFAAK